ncbi:MAG: CD1375 family protein [Lachnospiraceae bacterium]
MIAIYVRWIKSGKMTLEEVPERWRETVKSALK